MTEYPGGETLGIVEMIPNGTVDELNQNVRVPTVVSWVYGCVFEPYSRGPVEEQSDTITSHERAWAFLPYVAGSGIPGIDVTTGAQLFVSIDNATWIQPQRANDPVAQRNYKTQGLPEIEYDIDGAPSYAWVVCEWHGG
ncbi:MAG: hypothetical protein RBS21_00335 [Corynebacterium sp.]|nr:hypothetical protein [Corynebacterium sp.]